MEWLVDLNDLDSFVFNDKSNIQMLYVYEADNLTPFERDIEFIEVDGRNGDLVVDYERDKNKKITVKGYADCGYSEAKLVAREFRQWLTPNSKYKSLIFSNDLEEYEAVVTDLKIKEPIKGLLSVEFIFNCKRKDVDNG